MVVESGLRRDDVRQEHRPETKREILKRSPSGRVPCLVDGDLVVVAVATLIVLDALDVF